MPIVKLLCQKKLSIKQCKNPFLKKSGVVRVPPVDDLHEIPSEAVVSDGGRVPRGEEAPHALRHILAAL